MQLHPFRLLPSARLVMSLLLVTPILIWPETSRAESIQIFATIAAKAEDFQLTLDGPLQSNTLGPNSVTTYTLTYGSHLTHSTDVIVLHVSWSQGESDSASTIELLEYVAGSATAAIGGATPVVDLANRSLTWQISPMPPGTDHTVSWQLRLKSIPIPNHALFSISASLIGPGVEKVAEPLRYTYAYTAPVTTPTPNPSSHPTVQPTGKPTSTPTIAPTSQPPRPTSPIITQILDGLRPIISTIANVTEAIAEGGGAIVAAPIPILLVLIPAMAQIVTLFGQVPWWQLMPLLAALFWSRPKRPWGIVFDAATKQPIDPAIIILTSESGEQRTTLSDFYGRYQFLVDPGIYTLMVKKAHYRFPSQTLMGQREDGIYDDLYFGESITIDDTNAITHNIPLDPISPDWNQTQKRQLARASTAQLAWQWLFWAGLAWSIGMFMLASSPLNAVVLLIYILLLGLRRLQRLRSPWGVVYDQQGQPIAGAAVTLTNRNNPLVKRPPAVTNQSGRYVFLVEQGEYQLHVAVKTNDGYTPPSPGPTVTVHKKQGHIAIDLTVTVPQNTP